MNKLSIIIKRATELKQDITIRKKDLLRLLDFATGYKTLSKPRFLLVRFQKNDLRLIATLKQLHIQIREMQKEYRLLTQIIQQSRGSK
jgi:hypothetical protein